MSNSNFFSSVPGVAANRYCDKINSRYQQSASLLQTLKDRFNDSLANLPIPARKYKLHMLNEAIKEFQRRYPNVKKFKQLRLCRAILAPLDQILIDDTMQRKLDVDWVIKILANFSEFKIMPIQVYHPEGETGLYASWEGQHTAMVLFVISSIILKEENVQVPICIYEVSCKAEIRENFVCNNTEEGKKLLDKIDVIMQQIYGVRIDGSTNPRWIETELKQQYLESNGLFLTAEKFGDTAEPGAISRVDEFVKYPPDVIKELAMYLGIAAQDQRPVDSKEMYILSNWFSMGRAKRAEYTLDDMYKLYDLFNTKFDADFSPDGKFWKLVEAAYTQFKEKENEYIRRTLGEEYVKSARINKDWIQGGTYLWHLVNKYYTGPIPELNINTPFVPEV